jgi:hypothetical protein
MPVCKPINTTYFTSNDVQKQNSGKKHHYGKYISQQKDKDFLVQCSKSGLDCKIAVAFLVKNEGCKQLMSEFSSIQILSILKSKEFADILSQASLGDRHALVCGLNDLQMHESAFGEPGEEISGAIRQLLRGLINRKA